MRLPWPFGQRTPSDGPSNAVPAEGPDGPSASRAPSSTPTGAPGASAPLADAPPTGAWRSLPPIQRATGPTPLVASPSAFLADVPGHQGLPSIVPQLGHESSLAAPAGLVVARVSATPGLTSAAPMPMKPVQRKPGAAPGLSETWAGTEEAGGGPGAEPSGTRAAASTAGAPEPAPEPAPVRTLAAVAPSATVAPPARPLTVAPPPVPAPAAQRSASSPRAAASGGPSGGTPAPDARPTLRTSAPDMPLAAPPAGAMAQPSRWSESPAGRAVSPGGAPGQAAPAKAGLGAPINVSRAASSGPQATAADPATPHAENPPGPGARPALATARVAARRGGLGAPVDGPLPLVQRSGGEDTHPAGSAGAPVEPAVAAATRPLPVLPVARRAAAPASSPAATPASVEAAVASPGMHDGHAHGQSSLRTASSVGAATPSVTSGGPSTVPLLGARPLRPSTMVQRQADDGPESTRPGAVPAAWVPPIALPETVASVPPQQHDEDAVPLQRLPDTGSGSSASVPLREISFPAPGGGAAAGLGSSPGAIDAFAGPGLPGPATVGDRLSAGPATWVTGPRPVAPSAPVQRTLSASAGAPSRTAESGPLTLARPRSSMQATVPSAASSMPTVGRITADAPAPTVQASSASGSSGSTAGTTSQLPAFTATPVVQRVEGSPPEAPSKEGHTDTELDELAKAIFGRIRNHLRAEVIHEREAKGLTFDAF